MAIMRKLGLEDRKKIEKLLNDGLSCAKIAKVIGFGKNAVVVDVRHCGGKENYTAEKAQEGSDERHKKKGSSNIKKWSEQDKAKFLDMVKNGHSPLQIRKELKTGYFHLLGLYKSSGLKAPGVITIITDLEEKMYGIEEQLKLIFEMVGK